jgi:Cof subfamily protein (haloacid dehalogenase superfamily)
LGNIKLIASDLDGTFFGEEFSVHEDNIAAVRAARRAGIIVCACSARLWGTGRLMAAQGGFDRLAVFNNGACVADIDTGEIVHHIGIDPAHYRALIEAAVPFGAPIHSWNHEFVGTYGPLLAEDDAAVRQRAQQMKDAMRCDVVVYDTLEQMDRGCADVAQKIMLSLGYEHIERVRDAMARVCDVEVTSSNPRVIEITMPGATKGDGVKWLAAHYGVDAQNVLAIGDSHNDIGMLGFAGVKVAVDNAEESLKSVAQHIVGKNVDGGFAQAVYEFALGKARG